MPQVCLHYWAGARAAAGTEFDELEADSVADALDQARSGRDARFGQVVSVCAILIDGVVADAFALSRARTEPVRAEVLPPFAGGSGR